MRDKKHPTKKDLEKKAGSLERQVAALERKLEGPSYETVIEAADDLMKEGKAVSVGILTRSLGLEKSRERAVKQHMERAVEDGRYEERKQPMFAFKVNFSIYSPKGKTLPYLPSNMTLKEYDALLEGSLGIIYGLPDRFTQQKFHDHAKALGKAKGINARGVTMSVPSILKTYVDKGILETKDGNTYRKSFGKA